MDKRGVYNGGTTRKRAIIVMCVVGILLGLLMLTFSDFMLPTTQER